MQLQLDDAFSKFYRNLNEILFCIFLCVSECKMRTSSNSKIFELVCLLLLLYNETKDEMFSIVYANCRQALPKAKIFWIST